MSPQNCGSGLRFPCVSPDVSFTHHTASSILTTKTLLGYPHNVSCLGLCTKFTWLPQSLSSELFYHIVKKFCSPSSFADPESCHNQAAGHVSLGKGQDPLPGRNVKSWTKPPNCWRLTLWCQNRHTRDKKSWEANILLIKRMQACAYSS
jgi:hypothetical protein